MTAAIAIVTYNSEDVIGACLDSCRAVAPWAPVIVVDNASEDGTREVVARRPEVRLIANERNRGFAAAANQAMAESGAEAVLLLNPDTELLGGIQSLLEACQQDAGLAGGKLVDHDGRVQAGFMVRRFPSPAALVFEVLGLNRIWPANPVNRRYRCRDLDPEAPALVDQPAGAFLMLRQEAWRELGGFDENFHPLWFEDVDFCKRARDRGHLIRYVPSAVARHRGGHSARKLSWECQQLYWYASLLRWTSKHCRRTGRAAVCAAVALGCVPRMLAGILHERSLKPIAVCGKLIRLAVECLFSGRGQADGVEEPLLAKNEVRH